MTASTANAVASATTAAIESASGVTLTYRKAASHLTGRLAD
jgi:hypothetical protein